MPEHDDNARNGAFRVSTYSQGTNCVGLRRRSDGMVEVVNTKHPERGNLMLAGPQLSAFLEDCKAGRYDDLT